MVVVIHKVVGEDQKTPLKQYLFNREISPYKVKAIRLTGRVGRYCLQNGELYKRSITSSLFKCISYDKSEYILKEIHEGIYELHTRVKALDAWTIQAGFYLLTRDATEMVKRYDKCQRFALVPCQPSTQIHCLSVTFLTIRNGYIETILKSLWKKTIHLGSC